MKSKGFTLVELIVAIAILGIITAMAIPGVRKLQQQNRTAKFKEYEKSLEYAAKLYVDQKGAKDKITYNDLKDADLIKDFDQNGITCADSTGTYVTVTKVERDYKDKYTYKAHITCKKGGTTQYVTP